MAHKAVFVDRDDTLIEDFGYISNPAQVKLLPGVELAIKSLRQAGYKIVCVTNQSGVARGMFTEEELEAIHDELYRQLAAKGTELDGLYYCPYHPDGTVESYAKDSELRKPSPGMLLEAAEQMQLDLAASWMVGNDARDMEAGKRAGCRTVLIRPPGEDLGDEQADQQPQADHTVRNLVEAAREILRAALAAKRAEQHETPQGATEPAAPQKRAEPDEGEVQAIPPSETMDDSRVQQEILRLLRQMVKMRQIEEFSLTKLMGAVVQVLALLTMLLTFWRLLSEAPIEHAMFWATITVALQVMALTLFVMHQRR